MKEIRLRPHQAEQTRHGELVRNGEEGADLFDEHGIGATRDSLAGPRRARLAVDVQASSSPTR